MQKIKKTIAGQDPSTPNHGPKMKIKATQEVCEIVSRSGNDFELKRKDGSKGWFNQNEVENCEDSDYL
jgi:hypothetical protein